MKKSSRKSHETLEYKQYKETLMKKKKVLLKVDQGDDKLHESPSKNDKTESTQDIVFLQTSPHVEHNKDRQLYYDDGDIISASKSGTIVGHRNRTSNSL